MPQLVGKQHRSTATCRHISTQDVGLPQAKLQLLRCAHTVHCTSRWTNITHSLLLQTTTCNNNKTQPVGTPNIEGREGWSGSPAWRAWVKVHAEVLLSSYSRRHTVQLTKHTHIHIYTLCTTHVPVSPAH